MKATSIIANETSFKTTALDAAGKLFNFSKVVIDIHGYKQTLNLTECKRADAVNSYYYPEIATKKRIVLHFTEGYLKGDIAQLTQTRHHVSVPFIIARDGTIYNLWESKFWSYHIGGGCVGGNDEISSSSIAIELSNIGPLTLSGRDLLTVNNTVYCSIDDTQYYQYLTKAFRGYSYYASFTDAQYESLILLLIFLTNKFDIPYQLLPIEKRYNMFITDTAATASRGILSHVNFRPPGEKVDIGPAFNWDRIEKQLLY